MKILIFSEKKTQQIRFHHRSLFGCFYLRL